MERIDFVGKRRNMFPKKNKTKIVNMRTKLFRKQKLQINIFGFDADKNNGGICGNKLKKNGRKKGKHGETERLNN
jgi:hypothetical protein